MPWPGKEITLESKLMEPMEAMTAEGERRSGSWNLSDSVLSSCQDTSINTVEPNIHHVPQPGLCAMSAMRGMG